MKVSFSVSRGRVSRIQGESSHTQYGLHTLQSIGSHDLAVTLSCVRVSLGLATGKSPFETHISFLIGERVPVGKTHLLDDRTVCVPSPRQLAAAYTLKRVLADT